MASPDRQQRLETFAVKAAAVFARLKGGVKTFDPLAWLKADGGVDLCKGLILSFRSGLEQKELDRRTSLQVRMIRQLLAEFGEEVKIE